MFKKILLLLSLFKLSCVTYEEPEYIVLKKFPKFEIRKYSPKLVVEVPVESSFKNAGDQGFRVLADYIFGSNKKNEKIAMTIPVEQEYFSKEDLHKIKSKISVYKDLNYYKIRFIMPKKYSKKSLPTPRHELIKTREIPSELVAVRKYSGTWSKKNFEYQKDILLEELNKKKIKLDRKIIFSRYNSPYSLWFLRRNEVKIPIINELIFEKN